MGKRKKSNKKNNKTKVDIYLSDLVNQVDNKRLNSDPKYRIEVLKVIRQFKYTHTLKETKSFYSKLPIHYKMLLKGSLFPLDIKSINSGNFGQYNDDSPMNLKHMVILFSIYPNKINLFLEQKKDFEKSFLLADYDNAYRILEKTHTNLGYTNWHIYNTFLLKESSSGFEGNFNYLKYMADKGSEHILNVIFIFSFSGMVEKELSIRNYKKNLEIDVYSYYKIPENIKRFIDNYINPFEIFFDENVNGVFIGEEDNSLLDQYLLFKKVLINLFITNPKLCLEITTLLLPIVDDIQLKIIYFLLTGDLTFNIDEKHNIETYNIIDLYTNGNYEKCITKSQEYLLNHEISIDVIEVYVKSHINLNIKLEKLTNKDNSHIDLILLDVFNILKKNNLTDESLSNLNKIAFSLHNFDISFQLLYFINKVTPIKNGNFYNKTYQLYSPTVTPKIIYEFSGIDRKRQILDILEKNNKSTTIDFFIKLLDYEEFETLEKDKFDVPYTRLILHTSKILFKKMKYKDVISNLETLLPSLINIPHIYEECLVMLYNSYSEDNQYQMCINLYVDNYFTNKYFLNNISTDTEVKYIENLGYKELEGNIDLILFIHICKINKNILFLVYRMVMRQISFSHPSQINKDIFSSNKFVYFLYHICMQDVLAKDAKNFKTTKDVEKERVKICQFLTILNNEDDTYKDEIIEITQNIKIRERMIAVDNSKIYVDIRGLINYDLKNFNNNFSRFKRIKELTDKDYEEFYISRPDGRDYNLEESSNYTQKLLTQEDQLKSIFYDLFIEIRDKYLFSNQHGLDSYLSTRIRHGTITGQFRKTFTELKLITKKDADTEIYQDNKYWVKKLNITSIDEIKKFNGIMNTFSKKIDDDLTHIKDYLIQIKTENNSSALFNFSIYKFETLLKNHFSKKFKNFDTSSEFIDESIKICKFMTDVNLEIIKRYLDEDIKKNFYILINNLETELLAIDTNTTYSELINKVRQSRTSMQYSIDTIKLWFERKEIANIDFKISDVIATSEEIIKNLFSNITLNIILKNENDDIFSGKYFIYFVDCFKIFLENIINYVQRNNNISTDVKINIYNDNEYLICKVTNKLIDVSKEEIDRIDQEIKEVQNKIDTAIGSMDNRTEGKSGFVKATKIIKISLNDKDNVLLMKRENENIIIKCEIKKKGLIHEPIDN